MEVLIAQIFSQFDAILATSACVQSRHVCLFALLGKATVLSCWLPVIHLRSCLVPVAHGTQQR
jgi:hypothetical protein